MISSNENNHYDVIVIGSGMGGLATGSILAQLGKKRVLMLERHFKLGGFTHSFRRKDYEWDIGVHYVGEMQPGSLTRGMMNLVTRTGVKWHPMNSPFERFIFPDGSFEVPSDPKEYEQKLIERFPEERDAIVQYIKDVKSAQGWTIRWFVSKVYPSFIGAPMIYFGKKLVCMTTTEYLEKRFKSPLLRSIAAGQWPDYGTPPCESAFGIHATVTADYFHGGFYPIGGSKEIATHACKAITDNGGRCLVSHEVVKLLVDNGKVIGVTAKNKGKEVNFYASKVVSNAGGVTTFGKLAPPEACKPEVEQIARLKNGTSALILFLGLNDDPRKHGFDDCNYWLYSVTDHDTVTPRVLGKAGPIDGEFVSFGSIRNPGQEPHTAQVISFCDESAWKEFDGTDWMKRGEKYEKRKAEIAEEMLDFAEQRMPGLRKLIAYQELSTPLTVKSFTGSWGGSIYGQAYNVNRLFRDSWPITGSIRNLYLTGCDVGTSGVNGALMGGAMTAAKILGMTGLPRVMMKAMSLKDK